MKKILSFSWPLLLWDWVSASSVEHPEVVGCWRRERGYCSCLKDHSRGPVSCDRKDSIDVESHCPQRRAHNPGNDKDGVYYHVRALNGLPSRVVEGMQ